MTLDTNRRRFAEDAIHFEIVEGKIVRWRKYFDTAQMEREKLVTE